MASGQRTGRKPAEGQVGLVGMPTSRVLELNQQRSSEPGILTVKLGSKLPFRSGCEKRCGRGRNKPQSNEWRL